MAAFAGGPVVAGIVSVSGNLIYGMAKHMSYVYAITSVAFGAFLG